MRFTWATFSVNARAYFMTEAGRKRLEDINKEMHSSEISPGVRRIDIILNCSLQAFTVAYPLLALILLSPYSQLDVDSVNT